MQTEPRVVINPKVMLGKPIIRGTRITVELLLRKLGEGATEADILESYPHLTRDDIRAALAYAADTLSHSETVVYEPQDSMRFLADESCDGRVVRALRLAGHNVKPVREIAPELPDEDVIVVARNEDRVLITEDRDFGQIFFAAGVRSVGVILFASPRMRVAISPARC